VRPVAAPVARRRRANRSNCATRSETRPLSLSAAPPPLSICGGSPPPSMHRYIPEAGRNRVSAPVIFNIRVQLRKTNTILFTALANDDLLQSFFIHVQLVDCIFRRSQPSSTASMSKFTRINLPPVTAAAAQSAIPAQRLKSMLTAAAGRNGASGAAAGAAAGAGNAAAGSGPPVPPVLIASVRVGGGMEERWRVEPNRGWRPCASGKFAFDICVCTILNSCVHLNTVFDLRFRLIFSHRFADTGARCHAVGFGAKRWQQVRVHFLLKFALCTRSSPPLVFIFQLVIFSPLFFCQFFSFLIFQFVLNIDLFSLLSSLNLLVVACEFWNTFTVIQQSETVRILFLQHCRNTNSIRRSSNMIHFELKYPIITQRHVQSEEKSISGRGTQDKEMCAEESVCCAQSAQPI
jgi:hypothetical protein